MSPRQSPARSTTHVTHHADIAASAAAVYEIVADVGRWPLYFPPTVRTERMSEDGREERIHIWALANDELRSWESLRTLDPTGHTVRFEQTTPRDPVAAMGGAWSIHEGDANSCTVTLDHHYRAVGDDPVALERIARAVDTNSTAELEHLKRAAERRKRESELRLRIVDTGVVAGPIEAVYDFVYDAAKWPDRIGHVARVELHEHTAGLQFMTMDTRSPDGGVHTTSSGRVCEAPHRIVYKQTRLPYALAAHTGQWLFELAENRTVRVTSVHEVILDADAVAALPERITTLADARAAVRQALGANSRATMAAAKEFVEAR